MVTIANIFFGTILLRLVYRRWFSREEIRVASYEKIKDPWDAIGKAWDLARERGHTAKRPFRVKIIVEKGVYRRDVRPSAGGNPPPEIGMYLAPEVDWDIDMNGAVLIFGGETEGSFTCIQGSGYSSRARLRDFYLINGVKAGLGCFAASYIYGKKSGISDIYVNSLDDFRKSFGGADV